MGRISATFKRLRWEKEAALIPYLIVGYPSLDTDRQLVPLMARQGADLIILGIPSTPLLAGDSRLELATRTALQNGTSISDCLSMVADSRRANEIPLVLSSYYDPISRYGLQRFVADCAVAGVDGLMVPDAPPDAEAGLKRACDEAGVDFTFMVVPTSTDERIRRIGEIASGFICCLASTITPSGYGYDVRDVVARVRPHTALPLVAGSEVDTPEQVATLAQHADGAIVVGALITLIQSLPEEEILYSVGEFIRGMKVATNKKVEG
ncbi:MAG TPA: tryptophan synthase subunit alpha [Chloroflexia bacterium]|nr:tryptophan synthase subunit alpha [Chloroflexia bacterium]